MVEDSVNKDKCVIKKKKSWFLKSKATLKHLSFLVMAFSKLHFIFSQEFKPFQWT